MLNFNHPVKELIWTGGQNDRTGLFGRLPGSSTDYKSNDYYINKDITYNLVLNGQERMSARPLEYFTKQQVYDYHTGTPVGTGNAYTLDCNKCCNNKGGEGSQIDKEIAVSVDFPETVMKNSETKLPQLLLDSNEGNDDLNKIGNSIVIGIKGTGEAVVAIGDEIGKLAGKGFNAIGNLFNATAPISTEEISENIVEDIINNIDRYTDLHEQFIYNTGTGQASTDSIAVYSFALKPEEHQPSGTCNFSRIDSARLVINNAPNIQVGDNYECCCDQYDVYAVNYNVLRIMSGMGGLAYSN